MKIRRKINGAWTDITLTREEIFEAHREVIKYFMADEIAGMLSGADDETIMHLAEMAYAEYEDGNGLTQYECIEKIVGDYKESHAETD